MVEWADIQRALEGPHGDTVTLYESVLKLNAAASFPTPEEFGWQVIKSVIAECRERRFPLPHENILLDMVATAAGIYAGERLRDVPPIPTAWDTIAIGRFRDRLLGYKHKITEPEVVLATIRSALVDSFIALTKRLPAAAHQRTSDASFTVPLIDVLSDVGALIEEMCWPFLRANERGLFEPVKRALAQNADRLAERARTKRPIEPRDSPFPPRETVEAFLKDTLFDSMLLDTEVPFNIPEHLRIHTAVIAKTGWGKTQLLQHLILQHLRRPDAPSLIILDSTGAMVDRIQHLALFNDALKERLLLIDPVYSPALNMFDVSNPRFASYSSGQQEAIQTDIINLFNYIFSSKDYDLSGQMGLGFAYAVRLILSAKGKTVTDLRRLLEETPSSWEKSSFKNDILGLDEGARGFFQHHFFADSLRSTRASIARRIHALISIPAFHRMFTADSNVLDLYTETQEKGSIILVNTNESLLGRDGYILFGRYIVARAMAAAFERSNIRDERKRRETHLIIDEAAPYFDDSFDDLLTRVRQYGLKVTIAFQHIDQLTSDKLKNAVAGQTSVKYVGGLSPTDERRIAAQIRCEPEFITALNKDTAQRPDWSEWAVYVDGLTKHPMRLRLPFYSLESQPRMTDEQHAALIERNTKRVAKVVQPVPPPAAASEAPPQPTAVSVASLAATSEPAPKGGSADAPEAGSTW